VSDEFELKFKATLEGKEQIADVFTSGADNAEKFDANLQRIMRRAGSTITTLANKGGSELQALAGKELGGSLGSQARGVLQLRDALVALAVSSGRGTEIVGSLNEQVQRTSKSTNQLQGDITEAMAAFVERTGDLDTARRNIELYGRTATATGAAVKDLALVGVELSDKLNVKDQAQALAILVAQSKAGAVELRDLATKSPKLLAAAASAGATGEMGVREAGALAQVYVKAFGGTGAPASVTTAIENTFNEILKKSEKIEKLGVVNPTGGDRFEVLKDIIRATGGDDKQLLTIFGKQAIRGVDVMAREYRQTGGFGTYDKFRDVAPAPGQIDADFAARNSTGLAKLRQQEIDRATWIEKHLGGVAEFGAAHATGLQLGFAGAGLLGKGLSLTGGLVGRVGGAVGGSVGAAVSNATASRVFVTNWPGGGVPGAPGAPNSGGLLSSVLGSAGQFLGAAGVGAALGAAAGNYLDKHSTTAAKGYNAAANKVYGLTGEAAADKKLEDFEAARNKNQLARRQKEREDLIRDFEGKGIKHGLAIYQADQKMAAEIKAVNVYMNQDGVTADVETDNGTRSPKVMAKRGGAAAGGG
jgi:hypothetical protein